MKKNLLPIIMFAALALGSCTASTPKKRKSSSVEPTSQITSSMPGTSVTTSIPGTSRTSTSSLTSQSSATKPVPSSSSIIPPGPSSTSSITPVVPSITSVTLSPDSVSDLDVDGSVTITATVQGTGEYNKNVSWNTSDATILQISSNQNSVKVTALKPGTAVISAISVGDSSKSKSITIKVKDQPVTPEIKGIYLDKPNDVRLDVGETYSLTATVEGVGAYCTDVVWSVSDAGVITYTSGNKITITAMTPGKTILTASPKENSSFSASINITIDADFDLSHPMTYKKITSVNDLVIGDHYFIAAREENKAMSTTFNSSNNKPMSENIAKDGDLIHNVNGTKILVFRLENGVNNNSYSLNYKYGASNYYLQSSANDLKKASSVDASTSWNITIVDGYALFTSITQYTIDDQSQHVFIKYNDSGSLFSSYPIKSVVKDVDIYRYESGKEYLSSEKTEYDISTNTDAYQVSVSAHGFVPTSYSWESSDTSIVSVNGDTNIGSIYSKNVTGSAVVRCTASDGVYSAYIDLTINVKEYSYIDLSDGSYAIVSSNVALAPENLKSGLDFNVNDSNCYFSFNKAFAGDNTYYITANGGYLGLSDNQFRVKLLSEKFIWTITQNENGTYDLSGVDSGKTKHLTYNSVNTYKWGADETAHSLLLIGVCTMNEISIDMSNMKQTTFNDDEAFNPDGLKVNVSYNTQTVSKYEEEVASNVTWSSTYETDGIKGTVSIIGEDRDIYVRPLTITHYRLDSLILDSTNVQTKYQVGEDVNIEGLIVTGHYIDATTSLSKDKTIELSSVDYSPKTIAKTTEQITISYQGKSASYSIEPPQEIRFQINDHIKKGDRIVFTANGREMVGDGFNSVEFTNIPYGSAIFEVIQDDRYGYPYYLFKLVETTSEYSADVGKYLALDGSKKALTKLVSTVDDSCSWKTDGIDEETGYITLTARTGSAELGMNIDSNKFCCNPDAVRLGVTVWTEII